MSSRIALGLCVLFCACESDNAVEFGRFRVLATRGVNTCGAQSMQFDPAIAYEVELKVNNGTLRWMPTTASTASGTWSASTRLFRILLEQDIVVWPPDRRREVIGCTVHRTDVIEGIIEFDAPDAGSNLNGQASDAGDAGMAPVARSFRGTETIVFGPSAGADCRALVGAGEGQFTTMPCDVTYSLSGQRM